MSEDSANESLFIFTDAATSSKRVVAVGAFLCLTEHDLRSLAECNLEKLLRLLSDRIVYTTYHSKKSTWSEIQTVIDSLDFVKQKLQLYKTIKLFTDCQSVCDLLGRRKERLIKNNFMTRSGKELEHAGLYKKLFLWADEYKIEAVKVKGHAAWVDRATVPEKIFLVLDKLSRGKLREVLS